MQDNDKVDRLRTNAEYIETKYDYFYLRTITTQKDPVFHVMARIRNSEPKKDHLLVETHNRHVAYFTLETMKIAKFVIESLASRLKN